MGSTRVVFVNWQQAVAEALREREPKPDRAVRAEVIGALVARARPAQLRVMLRSWRSFTSTEIHARRFEDLAKRFNDSFTRTQNALADAERHRYETVDSKDVVDRFRVLHIWRIQAQRGATRAAAFAAAASLAYAGNVSRARFALLAWRGVARQSGRDYRRSDGGSLSNGSEDHPA